MFLQVFFFALDLSLLSHDLSASSHFFFQESAEGSAPTSPSTSGNAEQPGSMDSQQSVEGTETAPGIRENDIQPMDDQLLAPAAIKAVAMNQIIQQAPSTPEIQAEASALAAGDVSFHLTNQQPNAKMLRSMPVYGSPMEHRSLAKVFSLLNLTSASKQSLAGQTASWPGSKK